MESNVQQINQEAGKTGKGRSPCLGDVEAKNISGLLMVLLKLQLVPSRFMEEATKAKAYHGQLSSINV